MSDPARSLPSLLLPRTGAAIGGMAAAIVNAAMRVAIIPIFVTPVFDRVLVQDDLSSLPGILGMAAAVAIVGALALWAQDTLLGRAAARVAAAWRTGLYRRLLERAPGTLPGTSGGLSSRILTDLREIETYYHYGLGTLVAESVTLVGVLAYLFAANPQATLLLVAFGIPGFFVLRMVGKRLEGIADRSQAGMEALGRLLQEGFRHHETVRAFGADEHMLQRLRPDNEETARHMARRSFLGGAQIPLAQVLVFVAVGLLVVVLASSVRQGGMTAGETIGYLVLVALLSTPLQLLPKGWAMLLQARAAAKRLRSLAGGPGSALTAAPARGADAGSGAGATPRSAPPSPVETRTGTAMRATGSAPAAHGAASGRLSLEHVAFAYDDTPVLVDAHAALPDAGLVAIQGPSGSGKSTLLKLLLGFLEPDAGVVRAFGRPLRAGPAAELRSRRGYVPQDHALLSGSVRENVTLGRAIADEDVWRALADAGVSDAIAGLPGGLDHGLREDGAGLSGGQQQRVAIARALAGGPDVLLLDEPTSNLDAASEAALVTVLTALAQDRLVIAVAHRPALAERADRILHLREGRLEASSAGRSSAQPVPTAPNPVP